MAEITAAMVKSLRDRTGLPLMDCKKALVASNGDEEAAVEDLRKQGLKMQATRGDRETSEGRIAFHVSADPPVGAMVELLCESAPVASNDDFVQLAADLARQLATGPGAATAEELLAQPSPSKKGSTLGEQKDDLFNRIREAFNVSRLVRFDAAAAGYVHKPENKLAVLLEYTGVNADAARDVALHVAAMHPLVVRREDLDPELVAKEREIHAEATRAEGKPEKIIDKIVDGKMQKFFSEKVLLDQPFVKDDSTTVGKMADKAGVSIVRFELWAVGK